MERSDFESLLTRYKQGPMSPFKISELFANSRKFKIAVPRFNIVNDQGELLLNDSVTSNINRPLYDDSFKINNKLRDSQGEVIRGLSLKILEGLKNCKIGIKIPKIIEATHNYSSRKCDWHTTGYLIHEKPDISLNIDNAGGLSIKLIRETSPTNLCLDFPIEYFEQWNESHTKAVECFFEYWLTNEFPSIGSSILLTSQHTLKEFISLFTQDFSLSKARKSQKNSFGGSSKTFSKKKHSPISVKHLETFRQHLISWQYNLANISYYQDRTSDECKVIFCFIDNVTILELEYIESNGGSLCKLTIDGSSVSVDFASFYDTVYMNFVQFWVGCFVKNTRGRSLIEDSDRDFRLDLFRDSLVYCLSSKLDRLSSRSRTNDFVESYQNILTTNQLKNLLKLREYLGVSNTAHVYGDEQENISDSEYIDLSSSHIKQIYLTYDEVIADKILKILCSLLEKDLA